MLQYPNPYVMNTPYPKLEFARAYVLDQPYTAVVKPEAALNAGTIFPFLLKTYAYSLKKAEEDA